MKKLILFMLVALTISCSTPQGYDNIYIDINPKDLSTIEVKHNGGDFITQENGENFLVEFETEDGVYDLTVTSYNMDWDFAFFDGTVQKPQEEFDFIKKGRTLFATGRFLDGYDTYQISLSKERE